MQFVLKPQKALRIFFSYMTCKPTLMRKVCKIHNFVTSEKMSTSSNFDHFVIVYKPECILFLIASIENIWIDLLTVRGIITCCLVLMIVSVNISSCSVSGSDGADVMNWFSGQYRGHAERRAADAL